MQKINILSCCAECPAYKLKDGRTSFCIKENREIESNSENPVNSALVGFPEWCPLETEISKGATKDYRKEASQIARIVADDSYFDSLQEASYYLNKVVEDAKAKTQSN